MKIRFRLIWIVAGFLFVYACAGPETRKEKKENGSVDTGLLLGVQAYTFHKFSFREAIDKVNELGLHYIEAYYGQPLGLEPGEGKFSYEMDSVTIRRILDYAAAKDVRIYASGVIVPEDEKEWIKLFRFAKKMGIKVITCEPPYEQLPLVDSLANVYQVDVAIHNHPKPSLYWNPGLFLEHVKGLSDRVGACVDIGHLKRMGIYPVAALKKYDGRLKSLHIKDIAPKKEGGEEQHDIIWGEGVIDLPGVLTVLKEQHFKGLLSIEYEWNWENSVPDITRSIAYYEEQIRKIYK